MNKGTDTIVKDTLTLLSEEPRTIALPTFRRQERFWDEVRRRIEERRPNDGLQPDRLY